MARKRPGPKPPTPSSSGASDASDASEQVKNFSGASSHHRSKKLKVTPIRTLTPTPTPTAVSPSSPSSSDEEESGDNHDSAPKSVGKSPALEVPASGPSSAYLNVQKQKTPLFQRVWSLEDELALLRGLEAYHKEKGFIPSSISQMPQFHEFIRESLSITVNHKQLTDKVRRLKNKYETFTIRRRRKKLPFSDSYNEALYESSKKVWGSSSPDVGQNSSGDRAPYPFLREVLNNDYFRNFAVIESIDPVKATYLDKKFENQVLREMRLHLLRMDLLKEAMKTIIDG